MRGGCEPTLSQNFIPKKWGVDQLLAQVYDAIGDEKRLSEAMTDISLPVTTPWMKREITECLLYRPRAGASY